MERLSPAETRQDIRRYIEEHPQGISILPSDLASVAAERRWSGVVDSLRRITSGLKTLGVVHIEGSLAIPTSTSKS